MTRPIEEICAKILNRETGEKLQVIEPVLGFGVVNQVFKVQSRSGNPYILRLNSEDKSRYEYPREKLCLEAVAKLGIPSPQPLGIGYEDGFSYMLQTCVEGQNGTLASEAEQRLIWKSLGEYARIFNRLTFHGPGYKIFPEKVAEHSPGWQEQISYNIAELNETDPLLERNIVSVAEQTVIKKALRTLMEESFVFGLFHGDLSPRNVIFRKDTVYLLDWGTAEIGTVPYHELGALIRNNEAAGDHLHLFLEGMGINPPEFEKLKPVLSRIHLLISLDKYRWATDHAIENLDQYEEGITLAFAALD